MKVFNIIETNKVDLDLTINANYGIGIGIAIDYEPNFIDHLIGFTIVILCFSICFELRLRKNKNYGN